MSERPERASAEVSRARIRRRVIRLFLRLTPRTRLYGARARLLRLVGHDVDLTSRCVSTVQFHAPSVAIGPGSFCADEVHFYGDPGSTITIGRAVEVGPQVTFVARTHHLGTSERRAGAPKQTTIVVADGVWIGARATIIGPCHIGAGAVIAAGATVRGDVQADVLTFGSQPGGDRPLPRSTED